MPVVVAFSIFHVILFILVSCYRKDKACLRYIMFIWMLSSIFSIIFYTASQEYNKITIIPYIFFATCLAISIIPFGYIDDRYSTITIRNKFFFERIILFFCLISIIPFFENAIHLVKTFSFDNSDALATLYADKMEGDFDKQKVVNWYSPVGKICNSLNLKFQYCSLFLLFLYLGYGKINKYKLGGLLMGCVNPVLYTLSLSGRSAVVFTSLNAIFTYLMFRNYIKNRIYIKRLKAVAIGIFSIFILLFSIMTFARYSMSEGAQTVSMLGWISLYAGEGTLNFNQNMWHTQAFTEGDNCFAFIKYILGMDTFTDFLERRDYWGPKMGISPSRFYTFIGDIYSDLGYFIIPFLLTLSSILKKAIYKKHVIASNKLYILYVWGMLCVTGFTCFTYKTFSNSLDLFTGFLIIWLINASIGLKNKNDIFITPQYFIK